MTDRNLNDLVVELRDKALQFLERANAAVAPATVKIIVTWRSEAEQMVAFAHGLSNAKPRQSPHECCLADGTPASKAFDFGIFEKDGSYCQNGKNQRYSTCGTIGESLGLVWGIHFHKPDFDHMELADWKDV